MKAREVPEALRCLEEGHAQGKVVIAVEQYDKSRQVPETRDQVSNDTPMKGKLK